MIQAYVLIFREYNLGSNSKAPFPKSLICVPTVIDEIKICCLFAKLCHLFLYVLESCMCAGRKGKIKIIAYPFGWHSCLGEVKLNRKKTVKGKKSLLTSQLQKGYRPLSSTLHYKKRKKKEKSMNGLT